MTYQNDREKKLNELHEFLAEEISQYRKLKKEVEKGIIARYNQSIGLNIGAGVLCLAACLTSTLPWYGRLLVAFCVLLNFFLSFVFWLKKRQYINGKKAIEPHFEIDLDNWYNSIKN